MVAIEDLDLGFEDEDDVLEYITEDLTAEDMALVPMVVDVVYGLANVLAKRSAGVTLYPYQEAFGRRFIESVVLNDGDEITALFSRQSGKTETVADVVAAMMILLPLLAGLPQFARLLAKFRHGVMIGTFAPTGDQADTLFNRIVDRLTGERVKAVLGDPEVNDEAIVRSNTVQLRRLRSLVRYSTANPKAKIESKTYHVLVMDEAQGADERMWSKSISPMGASTNATKVMLGTPDVVRGVFYTTIKRNQRDATRRGGRENHFQFDWRVAAKYNPNYAKYVTKERARLGPDSDEFRLAYALEWILERGMFTTTSRMEELGDKGMQRVRSWPQPVIIGIDPARKVDSTVCTAVWVDWDRPNENGLFHHRVLDWLEMEGEDWENQYFRMVEFATNYNTVAVGVDGGGMGDLVASRLRSLLNPSINVVALPSSTQAQHERWTYLTSLMGGTHPTYGNLFAYPAHASARRTKTWRRFFQQMTELEKKYQGPYMLTEAPSEAGAHDDFPDSLALACIVSKNFSMPEIEVLDNFLVAR